MAVLLLSVASLALTVYACTKLTDVLVPRVGSAPLRDNGRSTPAPAGGPVESGESGADRAREPAVFDQEYLAAFDQGQGPT